MPSNCPALDTPGTSWPLCPSSPAAYIFAALFGITLVSHIVLSIKYRKFYCIVAIVSCAMQTGSFVVRILSIRNPTNKTLYSDWFILELVAPVWTNAFAYMIVGRLVYNFLPNASVLKIKAWRLGLLFVTLDIIAFFIQLAGLAIVGAAKNPNKALGGIHIYMAGIGFQEIGILFFLGVAVRFHLKLRAQARTDNRQKGLLMLKTVYIVVLLISIRIIFRLIEYAGGINSWIALHEVFEYVFDSSLMFIALFLFVIVHPGRIMPGKDSAWPSRKERKAMKKRGEVPHGHLGEGEGDYFLEEGYKSQGST